MLFKPKSSSRNFITYTCLACLFGGVNIANAQTVESIMHKNEIDQKSGAAIVKFKADSDPSYWLEKDKKTMRTQDDLAVFNPIGSPHLQTRLYLQEVGVELSLERGIHVIILRKIGGKPFWKTGCND